MRRIIPVIRALEGRQRLLYHLQCLVPIHRHPRVGYSELLAWADLINANHAPGAHDQIKAWVENTHVLLEQIVEQMLTEAQPKLGSVERRGKTAQSADLEGSHGADERIRRFDQTG